MKYSDMQFIANDEQGKAWYGKLEKQEKLHARESLTGRKGGKVRRKHTGKH